MNNLPIQIALISETSRYPFELLGPVAAAIQKQIARDFCPIWKINAVVAAFLPNTAPQGYQPIIIRDDIGSEGVLGYHTDENGQPRSLVDVDSPDVSQTISHEALEMLADPWGRRLWAAESPRNDGQRVRYLMEPCDPPEDPRYSYLIDGVRVSDFVTPGWYHTVHRSQRYSFLGHISTPRTILPGGYVSYVDDNNVWWQQTWWGREPEVRRLGMLKDFAKPGEQLREAIDRVTRASKVNADL